MRTHQSNGDDGEAGVDIGCPRIGGNGWWHLAVSAMDDNEITGAGCSMDPVMEFCKEVARQWRRRLQLAAAAAGD